MMTSTNISGGTRFGAVVRCYYCSYRIIRVLFFFLIIRCDNRHAIIIIFLVLVVVLVVATRAKSTKNVQVTPIGPILYITLC